MHLLKYLKNKPWIFWTYLVLLVLIAILPLNGNSEVVLNNTFVLHLRLDHLLHGLLYLPWVLLGYECKRMEISTLISSGILAAITLEGIQYVIPYRSFTINDMISNILGISAGIILFYSIQLYSKLISSH